MIDRISSRQNAIVRRFRDAARRRDRAGDALLDGPHLLEEAIAAGVAIEIAAFGDRLDASPLAARAREAGVTTIGVTDAVLAAISPVRQPSGVVAIARLQPAGLDAVLHDAPPLVIVLAGIQDPGNVGAIVRVGDACGATGVVTLAGTADPFGWKALRGAMGSAFRLPIAVDVDGGDLRATLDRRGIRAAAAVPRAGVPLPTADLTGSLAIFLGSEGTGLPESLTRSADLQLSIPMKAPVESLNVATAAALILYEAARQRGI